MAKIFATGATGYIGGDAFHVIANAHPEYEFTCLVRNSDRGALIASQYPKVRLVYGSLDDSDLLAEESSKADIVCHWADADHELAAKAIARGLASHSADHRGYWIHTSGTGILSYEDQKLNVIGQPSAKIYCDDDSGIREVTSLPPEAPHRNVDVIVLAASAENNGKVKTAIVCPPTIYGPGRGPGNQRSIQVYDLTSVTLQQGHGVMMGEGQNRWTNVHVHDLSNVYLELVEAAVAGGGKATLDDQGYYFTENGEFIWGEVSRAIAAECKKQGFIDTDEVVTLSIEQLDKVNPVLRAQWARNARGRAVRARKLFGWTPSGRGMYEELGDIVKGEAKNLGLMPGHAKKAAGHA